MDKPLGLIIEDDDDIAELYSHVLELRGFRYEIIKSAEKARERLATIEPDVVLLDLRLPRHMSGADILHQIRSDERLAHTRVVVISAQPHMVKNLRDEPDAVLIKPVEVEELRDLLAQLYP